MESQDKRDTKGDAVEEERSWENWEQYNTPIDYFLLGAIIFVAIYGFATMPAKVWLINHPWIYAMTHGGYTSATILGAQAGREGSSLLLPILVTAVFGLKFMPIYFFCGQRWGMEFVSQSAQGSKIAQKLVRFLSSEEKRRRSITVALVFLLIGFFPILPIPVSIILMVLGIFRVPFLLVIGVCLVGKLLANGLMATLGYIHGEIVIEVVEQINRYSNWVFFGLIGVVFVQIYLSQKKKTKS